MLKRPVLGGRSSFAAASTTGISCIRRPQIRIERRWVEGLDWKMGGVWWVAMQLYE